MCLKAALLAALSAATLGCSASSVSVDYNPRVDFSKLRTWAWVQADGARPGPPSTPWSPLNIQRAQAAIEAGLAAKGYTMTAPEQADMLVSVHFTVERRLDYYYPYYPSYPTSASWGYHGGPYWDGYWGPPAVYSYPESLLFVDILEPRPAQRLIWRGAVRGPTDEGLTPQERETQIRKAVQEVLAGFPPERTL